MQARYARIDAQRRLASGRQESGVLVDVCMREGSEPEWVGDSELGGGWRPRGVRVGVRD